MAGSLQGKKAAQGFLQWILGYKFDPPAELHIVDTENVHIQRAHEIMGPSISECIDLCKGFWGPDLSVEDFFTIVADHELSGSAQTLDFDSALRKVERGIDVKLREEAAQITQELNEGGIKDMESRINRLLRIQKISARLYGREYE
jgi:hypothetical protein